MNILDKLQTNRRKRAAKRKIEKYESRYRGEPKDRPAPIPVESSFDEFVIGFGGKKISGLIESKSAMPRNADYLFPDHSVIAELKTLQGLYAGKAGGGQLRQAFIDAGEAPSMLFAVLTGQAPMPARVAGLIRKRLRRGLEARVSEARKQLRLSRAMFGDDSTKLMIFIAMDEEPIFGHRNRASSCRLSFRPVLPSCAVRTLRRADCDAIITKNDCAGFSTSLLRRDRSPFCPDQAMDTRTTNVVDRLSIRAVLLA